MKKLLNLVVLTSLVSGKICSESSRPGGETLNFLIQLVSCISDRQPREQQ